MFKSKILPFLKRPRQLFLASLAVFALFSCGLYVAALLLTGNFHVVQEGELYRSAQPSPERIAAYHQTYGIRSIINLRGEHKNAEWYKQEAQTAKALGIKLINFNMSALNVLSKKEAIALIDVLREAPKPILLHCHSGSDRSGLASALYLAAISKKGEEDSESQLSFRFGHIGLPFLSAAYPMDETFENLEKWLGYEGS